MHHIDGGDNEITSTVFNAQLGMEWDFQLQKYKLPNKTQLNFFELYTFRKLGIAVNMGANFV